MPLRRSETWFQTEGKGPKMTKEKKISNLELQVSHAMSLQVSHAMSFLETVRELISGDVDGKDLQNARDELTNASNAIDDAMGIIDELLKPEPTKDEMPDIP